MDILINSFQTAADRLLDRAPEMLLALLVMLVAHFVGKGVKRIYKKILLRGDVSLTHLSFFGKIIYGFMMLMGVLIALNILGFYGLVTSILASGGITAVILGFAFKDIGENFLAGFFMAFSRPFRTGDLIASEGLTGRVKNIELRHTHVRTADGCDVFIPSAQLLSKPLYNYTRDGLRRGSFTIGIDYDDDAEHACKILLTKVEQNEKVIPVPKPQVQITGFNSQYIELTVYFWIEVDVTEQEFYLAQIKSGLMDVCRKVLIDSGFTFSSGVTTSLEMKELNVNLRQEDSDQPGQEI